MRKRIVLLLIFIVAAGSVPLFGQGEETLKCRKKATETRTDSKRRIVKEQVGPDELSWLIGNWGSDGDRAVATRASGGHYMSDLTIARDEDGRLLVTYVYTSRHGDAAVRHNAFQHAATWNEKQRQFHVETRRTGAVRDDGRLTFDAEELLRQPADKHIVTVREETGGSNRSMWSIWIKRPFQHEFSRFHPLPAVRGERDEALSWEELLLKFPQPSRLAYYPYDTITPDSGFGPIKLGRPAPYKND